MKFAAPICLGMLAATSSLSPISSLGDPLPPDTVIMIHGAGGGGWEYDRWKPVFQQAGWRVIARDLMPSAKGLAKTTFSDYAAQVRTWIPLRHGKLVLIGASMGGVLALKTAASVKADAIILVNSAPPAGLIKPKKGKPYPSVMRWKNGPIKETRDSLPDGDEKTVQWAAKLWRDESGSAMNELRKGVAVPKPSAPVLCILGKDDTDVPHKTGLAIAKWAHADKLIFEKTSHIGPLYGLRAHEIALAALKWIETHVWK